MGLLGRQGRPERALREGGQPLALRIDSFDRPPSDGQSEKSPLRQRLVSNGKFVLSRMTRRSGASSPHTREKETEPGDSVNLNDQHPDDGSQLPHQQGMDSITSAWQSTGGMRPEGFLQRSQSFLGRVRLHHLRERIATSSTGSAYRRARSDNPKPGDLDVIGTGGRFAPQDEKDISRNQEARVQPAREDYIPEEDEDEEWEPNSRRSMSNEPEAELNLAFTRLPPRSTFGSRRTEYTATSAGSDHGSNAFDTDDNKRLSFDSTRASASYRDSIFSYPGSSMSSSSNLTDYAGFSSPHQSHRNSLRRLTRSSTIFNSLQSRMTDISLDGDSPNVSPGVVVAGLRASLLPFDDSKPLNGSMSRPASGGDGDTSDWVAYQRRSHRLSGSKPDEYSDDDQDSCQSQGGSQGQAADNLPPLHPLQVDKMSIIDEGNSDICSNQGISPHSPGEISSKGPHLTPCISQRDVRGRSESTTGSIYHSSIHSRRGERTPATSIGEDIGDAPAELPYLSETDDSLSDTAEDSDDQLQKAFLEASLSPNLFPLAITLKDSIVQVVLERVLEWLRSHEAGEQESFSNHDGSNNTQSGGSGGITPNSQGGGIGGSGGKKRERGLDGHEGRGSGKGNGDDRDKRRRTSADPVDHSPLRGARLFACPFLKAHPGQKWPKCQRGFPEVRRIKDHIYRHHKLPIHCDRCYVTFELEDELREHRRLEPPCLVKPEPHGMIGIDDVKKAKLKSREGIQNLPEEEKWERMYKIIFPETEVPEPYYDLVSMETNIGVEMQRQYRTLMIREVPHRVIGEVHQRLLREPDVRQRLEPLDLERRLSSIIHDAVWDVFDQFMPAIGPVTGPLPAATPTHLAAPTADGAGSSVTDTSQLGTPETQPWEPDTQAETETLPTQQSQYAARQPPRLDSPWATSAGGVPSFQMTNTPMDGLPDATQQDEAITSATTDVSMTQLLFGPDDPSYNSDTSYTAILEGLDVSGYLNGDAFETYDNGNYNNDNIHGFGAPRT